MADNFEKRESLRESQRGVALLIVLISLTILAVMTADFMENNETSLITAVNHRDSVQAEYLARSGVNLSRLLLSAQSLPMFKQLMNFPIWEYADLILEPFSASGGDGGMMGEMMGFSLNAAEGLGLEEDHEFSIQIVDEDSKINVNLGSNPDPKMSKGIYNNLLSLVSPEMYDELFTGDDYRDDMDREEIIGEIFDYIDADDDSYIGGAGEEAYYSSTVPRYERKNAPFDSLEELHMVHGIGDDFWSAFVDPNPEDVTSRILTVWGKGLINVNTANTQVLYSTLCMLATDNAGNTPCTDPIIANNLIQILQTYSFLKTFMPAKNVKDFLDKIKNPESMFLIGVAGFPIDNKSGEKMLSTTSQVFSIYVTGTVKNATRRIHTVIDIDPKEPDIIDPETSTAASGGKIMYWRME
ncbi:MAG: general secretion pathway protein GspK [Deltaproteobacteria bacterium]|nr:general secretion pathway protein GspK [Deltaproteobacteria bacterium]